MDEIQKLYDAVSARGLYTKSFEEFKAKYESDTDAQAKMFDVVSREGMYTKSKDEFSAKYFTVKKKKKPKLLLQLEMLWKRLQRLLQLDKSLK